MHKEVGWVFQVVHDEGGVIVIPAACSGPWEVVIGGGVMLIMLAVL